MQQMQSDIENFEHSRRSQIDGDKLMIKEMAEQIEQLEQMVAEGSQQ